ncbi:immune inhibitor A [Myxococcota bacterium]|nr:immune inhibitor A [Myxococcota bacterium]
MPSPSPTACRASIALLSLVAAPCPGRAAAGGGPDARPPAETALDRRAQLVDDLAALRFDRMGDPVHRRDAPVPAYAPIDRPHTVLVVLVEFADERFDGPPGATAGPVTSTAPAAPGAPAPSSPPNVAARWATALFDPTYTRPETLSAYFRRQSLGTYHLQGLVLPPVRLTRPRAAYTGPSRPEGGDWRADAAPDVLVEEALGLVAAAHPALDADVLDRWDPADADGDGVTTEGDGYVDHLMIIHAGGDQAACQALHRLDDAFGPQALPDAVARLSPAARACAERPWPHRGVIDRRPGQGPVEEGRVHARGGLPLRASPPLWVADYNLQSERAEAGTFAHEVAHTLGLPDVYARRTQNSTGPWELMSDAAAPAPQNLSAWSRLMLGWLRPKVIRPPAFGGARTQSLYLRTLDAPLEPAAVAAAKQAAGLYRAALIILPPKLTDLTLTDLPAGNGRVALYSGNGNRLDRTAELRVDLRGDRPARAVELSFDAWWEIEAGWDFAYIETSVDDGRTWTRRQPRDPRLMPARRGHDGPESGPGFTGLSGDLDADGRNESQPGCDAAAPPAGAWDRAGRVIDPCRVPTWVRPVFDLPDLAGREARVRFRYVTDRAAVQRGLLIDDVRLVRDGVIEQAESFEGDAGRGWRLDGFLLSPGFHEIWVPHYYLLEFRDPSTGAPSDDTALARSTPRFYVDPRTGAPVGVTVTPLPGVIAWYVDGAFAWGENDPADHGQGRGFLLAVDATPEELPLPGFERWYEGRPGANDTHYALDSADAQVALRASFGATMCLVRPAPFRPAGFFDGAAPAFACPSAAAGLDGLLFEGRPLRSTMVLNETLSPGPARARYARAGDLVDVRLRDGAPVYRLRDRALRALHLADAPFAVDNPGGRAGLTYWRLDAAGRAFVPDRHVPFVPVARFDDAVPDRYLNPHLFFGGVDVPPAGLSFELAHPKPGAPAGARVKVWIDWAR